MHILQTALMCGFTNLQNLTFKVKFSLQNSTCFRSVINARQQMYIAYTCQAALLAYTYGSWRAKTELVLKFRA